MTRAEYLEALYAEKAERYVSRHRKFFVNPSLQRIDPFKIADGLYYVGDTNVCIHLIETTEGLILVDSGYLGATHLLVDSIWRAGFDPKDVAWIIHTHGHSDHFGASDEFRGMYGTRLAISRVDAERLRKPGRIHINKALYPLAKVPEFDRELEDGEIFQLGNVKIRCVLTPGHTEGVITLFFEVTDGGKTYLAGLFGGAGVNAISLPYVFHNESPADSAEQMLASIDKIWDEPVVVHLGNHPYNNRTLEKREQQLREGGNPFIAPDSWHTFLGDMKEKIKKIMADNAALEKEMQERGIR